MKDIRIIRLRTFDKFAERIDGASPNQYRSFSYYDTIEVFPVEHTGKHPFKSAYDKIQSIRKESEKQYQSQQIILAMTDTNKDGICCSSNCCTNDFWCNKAGKPLLFMTMINVALSDSKTNGSPSIDVAINRIKKVFAGKEYLLYLTYECSSLIIFYRGTDFTAYASLMMDLNYKVPLDDNYIIDSITIYSFAKKLLSNSGDTSLSQEQFGAYMKLGINDYACIKKFIDNVKKDKELGKGLKTSWLLGRNDIALWYNHTNLQTLYRLREKCHEEEMDDKIITFELSIMIGISEPIENSLICNGIRSIDNSERAERLGQELNQLLEKAKYSYRKICQRCTIEYDYVFESILEGIKCMLIYGEKNQIASAIVRCVLPQYKEFLEYLEIIGKAIQSTSEDYAYDYSDDINDCINSFNLNITALINSIAHSNRQFVQIPHCNITSFEMPPQIIAFYGKIARMISKAFNDSPEIFYGIMLSPKLVDELNVESLIKEDITEPDQFLSINISESMIYDLQRTICVLGHEMAHYVGNNGRCRLERAQHICIYYTYMLLFDLLFECGTSSEGNHIGQNDLLECSTILVKEHFETILPQKRVQDMYLRKLKTTIENIYSKLFNNNDIRKEIFQNIWLKYQPNSYILPQNDDLPDLSVTAWEKVKKRLLENWDYDLYSAAIDKITFKWFLTDSSARWKADFDNVIKYLFSESYADLKMILLFNMTPTEYRSIFEKGLAKKNYQANSSDRTELMRYFSVGRTLCKFGKWALSDDKEAQNFQARPVGASYTFGDILVYASAAMYNLESGNLLHQFVDDIKFDEVLVGCLCNYLNACVKKESDFLKQSKECAMLRKIYRNVLDNTSALDLFKLIITT